LKHGDELASVNKKTFRGLGKLGKHERENIATHTKKTVVPVERIERRARIFLVVLIALFVVIVASAIGVILFDRQQHHLFFTYAQRESLIYRAQRQASSLYVAGRQLNSTGNWLILQSALHSSPSDTVRRIKSLVLEGTEAAALQHRGLRECEQLGDELVTSCTRALKLYLTGLQLDANEMPFELALYQLSDEDEQLSSPDRLARASQILRSPELYATYSRFVQTLDAVRDLFAEEYEASLRHQGRIVNLSATLVGVMVLVLLALLLTVPHFYRSSKEHLRAFVEFGEQLSAIGSVRQAAEILAQAADRFIGWDACEILTFDKEHNKGRDILFYDIVDGRRTDVTDPADRLWELTPTLRRVLAGESLLLLRNPKEEPSPEHRLAGNRSLRSLSLIYAPIRKRDEIIGAITIQSYKPYAYDEDDVRQLEWLTARFGAAVERAQMIEAIQASEERYRLLIENTLDGVFIVDGIYFLYANRALATIFGYSSPEELVGKVRVEDLVSPRDREAWRILIQKRFSGEAAGQTAQLHWLRKDGEEIICESLSAPVEWQGKKVLLGTIRDVTARVQMGERLRAIQSVYEKAISAAGGVPYRLLFRTGTYEFADENAIEELTGFSPAELTWEFFASRERDRRVIYPLTDPEQLEALERMEMSLTEEERKRQEGLKKLLSGEADLYRAEILFERKDGRLIWLLDSAVMERDATGITIASVGFLQDITERKRLEHLSQVSADLGKRMGLVNSAKEAARILAEEARRLCDFDSCSITLYDQLSDTVTNLYSEDTIDGIRQEVETLPHRTPSEMGRKALSGEALLILRNALTEHDGKLMAFGDIARRSLSIMMLPLKIGEKVIGMAVFQSYRKNAFTPEILQDFTFLAEYGAVGLERVVLFERLAESENQLRTLWATAPIGIRLTDKDGIVWFVNPHYCALVEKSEEELIGQPFTVAYAPAHAEKMLAKYRERFSRRSVEEVLRREVELWNGKKVVVEVASRFLVTREGEMLLSVITDRTKEELLARELEAKNKELEQLASFDSLTGLMNRRLALELMQHELERAKRYRTPTSVLMIDIDHFKRINDTYGHLVGDEVLRQFGAILQKNARGMDIVGRYGGEEFLVVMADTGLDGALVFAERVRSSVEGHDFAIKNGLTLKVTCSIGVAQSDLDTMDADTLLARADEALYRAKQDGRNRVSAV
jgi:diguanylate cyclase (GGDEF)-like protein/PAS domain S-box-containing protein